MKDIKVGIIGCGNIAEYHANTLLYCGIKIEAIAYRNNYQNARKFAQKYEITNVFNNWINMIETCNIDLLWVIPSWDQIDKIFAEIISLNIPAFFEKPLALNTKRIEKVLKKYSDKYLQKYQIGYNRRFYKNISYLKSILTNEKIIAIVGELPETCSTKDKELFKNRIIQNSSHFYDLINYICGGTNNKNIRCEKLNTNKTSPNHFLLYENNGIPINITSVWNSPQNYIIKIYTESETLYQLCPIEILNIYKGFDVIDPTDEIPVRRYVPRKIKTICEDSSKFKPGFLKQTQIFLKYTLKSKTNKVIPTINQSYSLIRFLKLID